MATGKKLPSKLSNKIKINLVNGLLEV